MINELISAIFQIVLFTSIPFLFYIIKNKATKGFPDYIGLKKSPLKANLLALLAMVLLAVPLLILFFTNEEFKGILTHPDSVSGKILQMGIGIEAIVTILIAAVLTTSLSEEIFFRGFLAKRLISVTNFQIGNMIQAVVFGVVHTLIFLSITQNVFLLFVVFLFPTVVAYLIVHINEKLANGSIVPGWIAHGTANLVTYSTVLFAL